MKTQKKETENETAYNVTYDQTGKSKSTNAFGMREMQEKSIGASFGSTDLKQYGFFADWNPNPKYNLCTPGEEKSKVTYPQ